ncbi:leucyl aminopeptidase [Desulfotalea psychrophila]|uniref:Probable cytosol aminopeptidase n=1 Tax=Desulfotalea psychrophila (strain LSv54 / DSM 12343) TaxID=177439 RepID=AMPA_DESPS|nr:leucyl aminopeptidase [Desulfotalea psychrophila]Q6AJZ3.1 RecName: Full=Probable cytosol aminopeptidase; AltName: Full=Leucine aminopeptidase; Short=LAP; AltName: Full=Leucyl aminopeptidase [Desulfotalea psychrophila LSv54]CAG37333.1 related to cytosol aminopeptidase [Desulfotalea psychrophila LSv54]
MSKTQVVHYEKWQSFAGDLLVFPLGEKPEFSGDMKEIANIYNKLEATGDFSGKDGEAVLLYSSQLKKSICGAERILLLGLGKGDKDSDLQRDLLRQTGGLVAQKAAEIKATEVLVVIPTLAGRKSADTLEPLVEGVLLGDYRFLKYMSKKDAPAPYRGLKVLALSFAGAFDKALERISERAQLAADCGCAARDMAHEPGNGWTPKHFSRYAKKLAKSHSLVCTVLGKKKMKKMGMGGLLGVSQGSKESPQLVVLEYSPENPRKTVLMVGKGLTFDSGGVSLKPGAGMEEMKYDMCGGAAVICAMKAVAEEKPDVRVIAIVPATDNMAGGGALKPGDIISHYGGISSEVVNTDAEGRLILADALAYGVEKYCPDYVLDLATLTGAAIIALGHHHTALVSNSDHLVELATRAGAKAGEPVWRLPLTEEYRKQIKSEVADIKNVGGRPAGTITAAAYLEKFIGDTPWLHFDIAGTAWNFTEKKYIPKGPSGTGTRTLIEFIRSLG